MVNVLATGAHSARACEEPVAIASAPSNTRIRYGRLGIGHCRWCRRLGWVYWNGRWRDCSRLRGTGGGREVGRGWSLDYNGPASRTVLSNRTLGDCRCSYRLQTGGGRDRAVLNSRALADYRYSYRLQTGGGRDWAILNSRALWDCSYSCSLQITNGGRDRAVLCNRALWGCRIGDLCTKGTLETRAGLALLVRTSQKWGIYQLI